jgi:hypothetical protein
MDAYIELAGKLLLILSFVLMTPEFLQPETRKRLAEYGVSTTAFSLAFAVWFVVMVGGFYIAGKWLNLDIQYWELNPPPPKLTVDKSGNLTPTVDVYTPDTLDFWIQYFGVHAKKLGNLAIWLLKTGVSLFFVGFPFLLAYLTKQFLQHTVVAPTLNWLANNEQASRRVCKIGACLFIFGSALDLLAWSLRPK